MITLYGFGRVFPPVIGETKDLRVQWMLEETALPYRVHGVDHTGGEHSSEAFGEISPFHLLPAIDDDGFIVFESAAILLYPAEKSGKLIPPDFQGRTHVAQWCTAAVATVHRPLMEIQIIDKFGGGEGAEARRAAMVGEAGRWLTALEQRLEGREWITGDAFTVADLLMAMVLRDIRRTDLLDAYPRVSDFYARALARPAWRRTLALYAERLGVPAEAIA